MWVTPLATYSPFDGSTNRKRECTKLPSREVAAIDLNRHGRSVTGLYHESGGLFVREAKFHSHVQCVPRCHPDPATAGEGPLVGTLWHATNTAFGPLVLREILRPSARPQDDMALCV